MPVGRKVLGQVGCGIIRHQLAFADDHYPLANCLDLRQDMGRQDDRVPLSQRLDQVPDLDNLLRVKAHGRLIED